MHEKEEERRKEASKPLLVTLAMLKPFYFENQFPGDISKKN